MSTERVTVSLPAELMTEVRRAVGRGAAASISAYIAAAVHAKLMRERSLDTLSDLYGGPPPPEVLDAARRALRIAPPPASVR